MAGIFGDKDEERCPHYAQFASHLSRLHFDIIYWILFTFNLFVLFCASWRYMASLDVLERYPPGTPQRRRHLAKCIIFCLACVLVSTVAVVMEVYTLLALQFCDGEDLMSMYWSTWTMIQVGSLIAVIGIILALCHTIRDKKHPPWALALGTPVLVVAGSFHFMHVCIRNRLDKWRRKKDLEVVEGIEPPVDNLSRSNTLDTGPDGEGTIVGAEIVGFTIDGGPIIRFTESLPAELPPKTELLGRCQDDKPIVVCHRDGVKLIYEKSSRENTDSDG